MKLQLMLSKLVRVGAILLAISPATIVGLKSAHAIIGNPEDTSSVRQNTKMKLRNWGLENGFASHINVRKAWELTKGSREIVVAVIDTGIDPNHPDLKDNLWCKKSSERLIAAKNANDRCEYGWDFVLNKKNPGDTHGHGTHVAGIIGATAKGKAGAAGVALDVSIMAIRYYSQKASGAENLRNTIKAIHYAIENGADIINYSGGGAEFSAAELRAIQRARQKGILFVAAAGNEHRNTDIAGNKYYPGAYGLTNIISVAATDIRNKLLPSSNWGKESVDVAAPGENIFSTINGGKYGFLTGTSQATAFVSGLAALMLAKNKDLTPQDVKKIILNSVDKVETLTGRVSSGGRINAYAAVKRAQAKPDNIQLAGARNRLRHVQGADHGLLQPADFSPYRKEERRPLGANN